MSVQISEIEKSLKNLPIYIFKTRNLFSQGLKIDQMLSHNLER